VKKFLVDIDGVIKLGNNPAPFINEFLDFIYKNNIPTCFISNSTISNSEMIKDFFISKGIDLKMPVMSAADAALNYVKNNFSRAAVFCSEPVKKSFGNFIDYDKPECVVIGDLGKEWNFEIMNRIFNYALNGAVLIAMQKNKYWKTPEEGYLLDAGAFIKAIEYASGKESILIGKPSPLYFKSALELCGNSDDDDFLMLGDDLYSDIGGAQSIGGKGILIYTGKTAYPISPEVEIKPDYEVKDLKDAITLLHNILLGD